MEEKKTVAVEKMMNMSACDFVAEMKHLIKTDKCGIISVFVQGNIQNIRDRTPVFLTVHDMGCNHAEFHNFVEHPSMEKIKERSVFLHIEIPGQEYDALDLDESFNFPSMQELAEDLIYVLDYFNIKYVITLGEGAGANILTRFCMLYPNRVLGNVLLHCTSTVAGIMEYFNDKIINWKLQTVGMNPTAEQYLVFHKFGAQIEKAEDKDKVINLYIKKLKSRINPRNLRLFVDSFLNRSDLSGVLRDKMKVDTLLVTGAKASHVHTVHTMHTHMDPKWTTLLKIDDVGDVMNEVPHRLAHNILLFCQGLGLLSALSISRQSSLLSCS